LLLGHICGYNLARLSQYGSKFIHIKYSLTYLLTYRYLDEMDQRIIDAAIRQWRTRLRACITAKGGHFEHTLRQ